MELFAQVGGVLPFAAERFVFVSAGPTTPEAARFAEATKHPILEKPFDAEELREAVRGAVVLGEQRRAKPSP
jgi:hypothetical protein